MRFLTAAGNFQEFTSIAATMSTPAPKSATKISGLNREVGKPPPNAETATGDRRSLCKLRKPQPATGVPCVNYTGSNQ